VKKYFVKILLFFIISLWLFSACKSHEQYPTVPVIEFLKFTKSATSSGIDEKGTLKISFIDGEGDIGLREEDTIYPFDKGSIYYYDFFIKYFEKQNGVYKEVIIDSNLTFNSRIPYVTTSNKNPNLRGEIELELFINNYFSKFDTIRFEAQICDRALNMSNSITTPDIIISKQ